MARRILLTLSLFFILTFPIWAGTAIHNIGAIDLTIDDDGGWSGWETLEWGVNDHLFDASFMLGISSINVLNGRSGEWLATTAVSITDPGSTANEDGYAVYGNTANDFSIVQYSYAWADSPNDDFVILKYVVTNMGTTSQTIYLGIYIDYDVNGDAGDDSAGSDASRDLAYIYESNYAGIKLLSGTRHSCNIDVWPAPSTDSECWTAMTNGEFDTTSAGADDTLVLSAGPFTLAPNASTTFAMAYVMGSSLDDLKDNADAAQRRYDYYLGGTAAGGGTSEFCFIATAAYGSQDRRQTSWLDSSRCSEYRVSGNQEIRESGNQGIPDHPITRSPDDPITVLQKFRDERLLTNPSGRAFVSCYERISPPIARYIEDKEPLKAVVRFYLKPIVWGAKKILK